eukprot:m.309164 g.309164  ORF g.309164 m.309164 type:complete len:496 (+) comp15945_c0_seq5:135-1622(+)
MEPSLQCTYSVEAADGSTKELLSIPTQQGNTVFVKHFCRLDFPLPDSVRISGSVESDLASYSAEVQLSIGATSIVLGTINDPEPEHAQSFTISLSDDHKAACDTLQTNGRTPKLVVKSTAELNASSSQKLEQQASLEKLTPTKLNASKEETPTTSRPPKGSAKRRAQASESGKKAKSTARSLMKQKGSTVSLEEPTPRWGCTFTGFNSKQAILFGGQGTSMCKDAFWLYNADDNSWEQAETKGDIPPSRVGHAAVVDEAGEFLYMFGGAKFKRFFKDIHRLNLKTMEWEKIQPAGGTAPALSYHSCVLSRNLLIVFGGNFPNPDPIPDGCSDLLYCFDLEKRVWFQPSLLGDAPSPRSGHSSTIVGDKVIIFGGWDAPACHHDVFQFDMTLMESQRLHLSGIPPSPRTWHIAYPIERNGHQAIVVQGGYDGDKALQDAFVMDLTDMAWYPLTEAFGPSARAGHDVALVGTRRLMFGGGNNDGDFFHDVFGLPSKA